MRKKAALITYVAHCKRLVERKPRIAHQLKTFGLNTVWVEEFDPPEIPDAIWLERVVNDRLSEGEVSIYLKHEQIYRTIAKSGATLALVLEDDAIFASDFGERFPSLLERLPDDCDMAFLASSIYLPLPEAACADEREFLPIERSRTTVARLVSSQCARDIAKRLDGAAIEISNDLTLDRLIGELDLKTYWLRDPLFVQGSETGVFPSSLGVPWRESTWSGKLRAVAAKRVRHWRTHLLRAGHRLQKRRGCSD
jgi:GR25 family glycosyltransferase involved in LPS biosynthesis